MKKCPHYKDYYKWGYCSFRRFTGSLYGFVCNQGHELGPYCTGNFKKEEQDGGSD